MAKNNFNQSTISSRYKAWDKNGVYKGVVSLTNETKRRYEEKGFTFVRTSLREAGLDYGS